MIKGFGGASIWSQDLNNLLPFYRDTLGLKPTIESERFVLFGDPNAPSLGLGSHSEVKGKNNDPARHMVGLMTDDVRAEYQRLKSKGVEFVEEPTNYDQITIATLKDPEGNLVQLFQMAQSPVAYNETLADRIRAIVGDSPGLSERKMFGGIAFMLNGNMFCGVVRDDLMARVGPDRHEEALASPGARPMDFAARPMKGMVFVGLEGYRSDKQLRGWVEQTLVYARSLPVKKAKRP